LQDLFIKIFLILVQTKNNHTNQINHIKITVQTNGLPRYTRKDEREKRKGSKESTKHCTLGQMVELFFLLIFLKQKLEEKQKNNYLHLKENKKAQ